MRIKPLLLLAAISLNSLLGFSQVGTQQIDPSYLTISDGLASPNVQDVMQDSYGLLWIATTNGVQKYDGYRLETFKSIPGKATSLQSNNAWGLEEDANNDIWVATDEGASRFDRKKNEFINYPFTDAFNLPLGGGLTLNIFEDSSKRLWATTQNMELVRYDFKNDNWTIAPYQITNVNEPIHNGFSIGLTEDAKGGIWFGSTVYGLMHMAKDESAFRPVTSEQWGDFDFVNPENFITSLFSDANNTLWLTTRSGVYKYNPETGALKVLIEYEEARNDIWNNWNRILPDHQGNIWVANNFRGLLKFEGTSDRYEEITIDGKVKMRGHGWNITMTDFIIDRSGIFWFGSRESGLLKYDPVNKPFSYLTHVDGDLLSLSPNGVYGMLASKVKPGIVYVGTRGGGLNIYDPKKRTFEKVTFNVVDDMFGGSVRSIAEDADGSLWLGTWGDGLIKLDKNYRETERYKYETQKNTTISNDQVRVIRSDKKGRLWLGTNNGLNIFEPKTGEFQRIISRSTKGYPQNLVEELEALAGSDQNLGIIDKVQDFEDRSLPIQIKTLGTYWVMSVGEGDARSMVDYGWIENAQNDTIWHFGSFDDSFYAGGAAKNRVVIQPVNLQPGTYSLRYRTDDSHAYDKWNEDPPDQSALYGIMLINPSDESQSVSFQKRITESKQGLVVSGNNIADIEIGKKYIWVSANSQGLSRINPDNNTVKYFNFDPDNENSLSSDIIYDILEDSRGMIWFATAEGINLFDPDTEKFIRYSEADGLPTNLTEAILEGDNGEMWIATQNGLSQMVPNETLGKVTFINYDSSDGLGGDIFLSLAAARSSDGQFYFGGEHGLTTFNSVAANNTPPTLIISNVLISNKSVLDMGEDSPLTNSLLNTENINLSHQQNNLSFEYAALHFANPEKNQYAHKLIGYDEDWIYDNRNFASYTNLDPGNYEFAVRASNAYGIWNEEGKTLSITISPPWWRTLWAYVLYASVLIVGFLIVDRFMRNRIKQKERERSRDKELAQAKEIEKAYSELKNTQSQLVQSEKMASLGELTAGIAHEIQNPLNFVNNFSEVNKELLLEMDEEIEKGNFAEVKALAKDVADNEDKIIFHGKRADGIVKGMLQHSRSSSGQKEPTDINVLADEYLRLAYHGLRAKDKSFNATLNTDFDQTIGKINIVPQDIGRVILNLITNAFYVVKEKKDQNTTGYEPTVTVSTKQQGNMILVSVQDNGNGIPKEVLNKIFQPFFTTKPSGQGTGLGLSMSYDIIKAHSGDLKVETKEGEGTTFIIKLPKFITTN
ncbi:MAG: two-component regulator propeller domain-containing protein [Maribacter sp.]|uniref:two-component regulator propeller domain-containing protein n=1 Tax=Maribacter sp. TaxID=1897614 RepID=UPI003C7523ED